MILPSLETFWNQLLICWHKALHTTAISFFSFSRAISHFCSVFRGHLWKRRNFIHITKGQMGTSCCLSPRDSLDGNRVGAKQQISQQLGKAAGKVTFWKGQSGYLRDSSFYSGPSSCLKQYEKHKH